MKRRACVLDLVLIACLFGFGLRSLAAAPRPADPFAHSVQVDPGFAYYRDRSPESVASELLVNGYTSMRYIVTQESSVNGEWVAACRAAGLAVSFTTLGNGVYSKGDLPPGWEAWQMVLAKPGSEHESYTYFCLNHPDYRRWKKAQVLATLRRIQFDAFEVMESFWPGFEGPGGPRYGCLCSHCCNAFLQSHPGVKQLPNFTVPTDRAYYLRDSGLYRQWVAFRARSVAAFLDDLVNGSGGVRESFPKLRIAIWGIADAIPDAVSKIYEWEGIDGALLVRTVRPDLYVIQTDWPDWTRPGLPADYVRQYKPFVDAIRAENPTIPIQVQTDTGSNQDCRRSRAWLAECAAAGKSVGIEGIVAYEYHLSRDIYEAAPRPVLAVGRTNRITLTFNKRLAEASASDLRSYRGNAGNILSVTVDGNLVVMNVAGHPTELTFHNIADDPRRRFFKNFPPARMPGPVTLPVDWR